MSSDAPGSTPAALKEVLSAMEGLAVSGGSETEPAAGGGASGGSPGGAALAEVNDLLKLLKQPTLDQLAAEATQRHGATAEHRFWDTQPVPKLGASITEEQCGPIDDPKTPADIKKEPYALPPGFEWCTINVLDTPQLSELYTLLWENYVEDDDNMFRFNYSPEFLVWALTPPGYYPDWLVGVRATKTGKLVACITGVPAHLRVYKDTLHLCEINFLCVHKKLRSKRLAPVLIKEVTRRVNLTGIFQATYTAGKLLPRPVSKCQYFHRSVNPKKLIECGFSALAPRMTMALTQRLYALPDEPKNKLLRPLRAADVPAACALLNDYLSRFSMAPVFSEAEFTHTLLPREGVVDAYVVDEGAPGGPSKVTALISFYHLPSTVIGNPKHSELKAMYSFYNAPGSWPLAELLKDALVLAKGKGCDVFNALTLQEQSEELLKELKFAPGDGTLFYYLYNWACPDMPGNKMGLVLL